MKTQNKLIIGIDACRIRSGGGIAHLEGILGHLSPEKYGISTIHLWSYNQLLNRLPDFPWLVKQGHPFLEKSLFFQLYWQRFLLPVNARIHKCNILFSADASTVCPFKPSVVLSQDMLSYEKGQMQHYGLSLARLRLVVIGFLQIRSMKKADGVIFLSQYASQTIKKLTGNLDVTKIIPHGVPDIFRTARPVSSLNRQKPIRCIYVSNVAMYKHQWTVVEALDILKNKGYNISLTLVGGGKGTAQYRLEQQMQKSDPEHSWIKQFGFLPHSDLPAHLSSSDIFIFASSCENLPVTLIEAMASGLPIACSDRGPMPEVLQDGGVYFNPENCESIAAAIENLINNDSLRTTYAKKAKLLSRQFTWQKCADETFSFFSEIIRRIEYGK